MASDRSIIESSLAYPRILLKLSGEGLGKMGQAIHSGTLLQVAKDIAALLAEGVQLGIVVGGGNWFRGVNGTDIGLSRITGDYIGMLATLMNALALQEALEKEHLKVHTMSALAVGTLIAPFDRHAAKRYLKKNHVVIFAGGTGHPLVSTDAAASLRGLEIEADLLLKATAVDGIYSSDPLQHPEAVLYKHLTYQEVLASELRVMDLAAFCQCRDHGLPIRVFNMHTAGGLLKIARGENIGTLVSNTKPEH